MKTGKRLFTDFSGGEVGAFMYGRFDLEGYRSGCEKIENIFTYPHGGATRMPGTYYMGDAYDESHEVILFPYLYDTDHYFILEIGNEYMRIWDKNGEVHQTVTTDIPWTGADVRKIQVAGIEEWRVFACEGYAPIEMTYDTSTEVFSIDAAPSWLGIDFGTANYYPAVVAFHQERLIFANTPTSPNTVYASQVGNRYKFELAGAELVSNDYYEHTIGTQDASPILWVNAYGDGLLFATSTQEFSMRGGEAGINPGNFNIQPESTYGSAPISGRMFNDSLLFIQRYGRKVREYVYEDSTSPYLGQDLTMYSHHICGDGIIQTSGIQDPYSCFFMVREDGTLVGMTRVRALEVLGYHRHTTDGQYESVAVVPGTEHDEIWVVVKREIEGSSVRYIEKFESFVEKDLKAGVYMHSAKVYNYENAQEVEGYTTYDYGGQIAVALEITGHGYSVGEYIRNSEDETVYRVEAVEGPNYFTLGYSDGSGYVLDADFTEWSAGTTVTQVVESVSGLAHLEGKEVAVLADGGIHDEQTVDSGAISLDRWATYVIVGLPYSSRIKTMPGALGQLNRMTKMSGRFYRAVGCLIGDSEENLRELLWLEPGDVYYGPVQMYSGDKQDIFPGTTKPSEAVVVGTDYPLPWTITALMVDVVQSSEV